MPAVACRVGQRVGQRVPTRGEWRSEVVSVEGLASKHGLPAPRARLAWSQLGQQLCAPALVSCGAAPCVRLDHRATSRSGAACTGWCVAAWHRAAGRGRARTAWPGQRVARAVGARPGVAAPACRAGGRCRRRWRCGSHRSSHGRRRLERAGSHLPRDERSPGGLACEKQPVGSRPGSTLRALGTRRRWAATCTKGRTRITPPVLRRGPSSCSDNSARSAAALHANPALVKQGR